MPPDEMLQIVIIGLSGWTLREVYRLAREVERIKQRMTDLPCDDCTNQKQLDSDL